MRKRKKAVLGAAAIVGIGAGVSLLSSIGSSLFGSSSQKKLLREQQKQQNRNDTLTMAQNLTAGYSNQDYVNDYFDRVTFKYGGRKKADTGATTSTAAIKTDWTPLINGISSGLSSLSTGAINASTTKNSIIRNQGNMFANTPKTELKKPEYKQISQTGYLVPNNTQQLNNVPIKDKMNVDYNDIKPTSITNSPYQFTPMQLFCLGGRGKFYRR